MLLNGGWPNHPAAKMWKGHFFALARYALAISTECVGRGYKDSRPIFQEFLVKYPDTGMPPWLGKKAFHLSHRFNLLRKDRAYYCRFFPQELAYTEDYVNNYPYFWPVK